MKQWMQEVLICPECLADNQPLELEIMEQKGQDIWQGSLSCQACGAVFPIKDGIAILLPKKSMGILEDSSGYNSQGMLSAYLWSHFSEFFNGQDATDAYAVWSSLFEDKAGPALDIGCSVGRLSLEMSKTHSQVIGLDTSLSFIKRARQILLEKELAFDLILEGNITETRTCDLDRAWNFDRVEFIVADALALPFPKGYFSTASSINILEKVPYPSLHLEEVNRVLKKEDSMFVFSDPFSWDASVSDPDLWLGGRNQGKFAGRGIDIMKRFFLGDGELFHPPFEISKEGRVVWKIRKTENLWEHITSQYIIGKRN